MAAFDGKCLTVSCFFTCLGVLWTFGTDTIVVLWRSILSCFLFLAVTTLVMSYLYPRLKKLILPYYRQLFPEVAKTGVDYSDQQLRAADRLQEVQDAKASSYRKRVLEPRQEARLRQREQELERSLNPAWKGKGHKLGKELTELDDHRAASGPSIEETAPSRRPPELKPQPDPTHSSDDRVRKGHLIQKKVVDLPPEPPENSPGQVVVMLRTPQGRLHQRRFDQSHRVQVLFDYMTTIGYHPNVYTLFTSYPLRSLHDVTGETLEAAGVTGRVKLNVDRLDPD